MRASSSPFIPLWTLCALCLITLPACGDGDLEVRGNLDRVVGETVTLSLVEGDPPFSGQLSLRASDGTRYSSATLKMKKKSVTELTFVIPPDVAAGKATVQVGKAGEDGAYDVPLQINRLALGLTAKGTLEAYPLPPTSLKTSNRSVAGTNSSSTLLSMASSGGLVAALSGGQLSLLSLGASIKERVSPITQAGQCLAALDTGVLVGTKTNILLYSLGTGKTIKQQATFNVAGCKTISVSGDGTKALVLSHCDTKSDGVADSDCLTEITLGTNLKEGKAAVLDSKASATLAALSAAGKTAVVADGDTVYGVVLDSTGGNTHKTSKVSWGVSAIPVALARSPRKEKISGKLVDLFAVADSSKKLIRFVGVDVDLVKWVELGQSRLEISMSDEPSGLSFGRRLDLYATAAKKLYHIKSLRAKPQIVALGTLATQPISSLVVQP